MLSIIRARGPFYGFLLIIGLIQFFVALRVPIDDTNSPYLPLFTTACAIAGLFTFLWVFILLGYGRSEFANKHILTRCNTHLVSLGLISFIWFCLGVFLAINTKNECDSSTIICEPLRFCAILAVLMLLLALFSAAIVAHSVKIARLGYNKHVEYVREQALEQAIERVQAQNRPRSRTNNDHNGQYILLPDLAPTTRPPPVYAARRARQALPV